MTIEIKKPRYNKETIEAINEAIKMMKNPKAHGGKMAMIRKLMGQ